MRHARPLATLFLLACAATVQAQICGDGVQAQGQSLCVSGAVVVIPTNGEVRTVLAYDVNVDGHTDIVAVTPTAVYLRFGVAGGLGSTVRRVSIADHTDMAIGLFDDNGRPDLAITDRASDRVLVSYDFGDGNLAVDATVAVGDGPTRVRASDFNGDGFDDLAVLNDAADSVSVLRSSGAGFAAATHYPVGDAPDIALGNLDGANRDDLVYVTGQGPTALLNVRPTDTAGLLLPAIQSAYSLDHPDLGPLTPTSITTADLDHDALADVVVGTGTDQIRLVAGLSTGGGSVQQMPLPWAWAWASTQWRLRTVDWDRDGNTDIASPHVYSTCYSVTWGNGDGTFGIGGAGGIMYAVEDLAPAVTQPIRDLAFADLDGDGHPDVAIATGDAVLVQRGNP